MPDPQIDYQRDIAPLRGGYFGGSLQNLTSRERTGLARSYMRDIAPIEQATTDMLAKTREEEQQAAAAELRMRQGRAQLKAFKEERRRERETRQLLPQALQELENTVAPGTKAEAGQAALGGIMSRYSSLIGTPGFDAAMSAYQRTLSQRYAQEAALVEEQQQAAADAKKAHLGRVEKLAAAGAFDAVQDLVNADKEVAPEELAVLGDALAIRAAEEGAKKKSTDLSTQEKRASEQATLLKDLESKIGSIEPMESDPYDPTAQAEAEAAGIPLDQYLLTRPKKYAEKDVNALKAYAISLGLPEEKLSDTPEALQAALMRAIVQRRYGSLDPAAAAAAATDPATPGQPDPTMELLKKYGFR